MNIPQFGGTLFLNSYTYTGPHQKASYKFISDNKRPGPDMSYFSYQAVVVDDKHLPEVFEQVTDKDGLSAMTPRILGYTTSDLSEAESKKYLQDFFRLSTR